MIHVDRIQPRNTVVKKENVQTQFSWNILKLVTHAFDVVNHNSIKTNFSLIKRDHQNRTIAVCTQKDKSLHYKTSIIFEFLHFFFWFFSFKNHLVCSAWLKNVIVQGCPWIMWQLNRLHHDGKKLRLHKTRSV